MGAAGSPVHSLLWGPDGPACSHALPCAVCRLLRTPGTGFGTHPESILRFLTSNLSRDPVTV